MPTITTLVASVLVPLLPKLVNLMADSIVDVEPKKEEFPDGVSKKEHVMNALTESLLAADVKNPERYAAVMSVLIDLIVEEVFPHSEKLENS